MNLKNKNIQTFPDNQPNEKRKSLIYFLDFNEVKFSNSDLFIPINTLIYGKIIDKYYKNLRHCHKCLFYISERNKETLQWLSHKKNFVNTRIHLSNVKEISDNILSDSNLNKYFKQSENMLFVFYESESDKKTKKLVLKFENNKEKAFWWQGLQYFAILSKLKKNKIRDQRKIMAKTLFFKGDLDGDNVLNAKEIKEIFKKLHFQIDQSYINKLFDNYDIDKNNQFDWSEFKKLIKDITLKEELKEIYDKYCKKMCSFDIDVYMGMNSVDLKYFYLKEQKEILSNETLNKIIEIYKDSNNEKLMFSSFCSLIFSEINSIFDPVKAKCYQNMDLPLTDYYICSSHNTYLTANQLTSESNTNAYINALMRGCRCLEIDCWDGENGEPTIHHGFTFTSKILLEDVLVVINQYAFTSNSYPIILSIENHCSLQQQETIAKLLISIFQEKLYILPINYLEYNFYPSPNELKNKIIIKDKSDIRYLDYNVDTYYAESKQSLQKIETDKTSESDINSQICESSEEYIESKSNNFNNLSNNIKQLMQNVKKSTSFNISQSEKNEKISSNIIKTNIKSKTLNELKTTFSTIKSSQEIEILKFKKEKKKKKKNLNLLKIISLFGIKMNLTEPRSIWTISSLQEKKISKILKKNEIEIINFHKKYFTRIYPSGTRISSSNYDPIEAINAGSQLVALNTQTKDLNLLIYLSKFLENGSCGFVLKPNFYLSNSSNPKYIKDFKNTENILILKIISGQQIHPEDKDNDKDVIDPYVTIHLRGIPIDEDNNKIYKSKVVKNNGFHPIFNLDCEFRVCCPELTFIVFEVFDEENGIHNDNRIAWYSIPFNCIREGFRVVPLYNKNLYPFELTFLLCLVNIRKVL